MNAFNHHPFAYESFQSRLEMGALNGPDACPFELLSMSPKLRFWLNVLKIENPPKRMDTIVFIGTFPFNISTPIRPFEILVLDFHTHAASTKAQFLLITLLFFNVVFTK